MDGSERGVLSCIRQLEQNFTVDQILGLDPPFPNCM
jgi:hypothetical protein